MGSVMTEKEKRQKAIMIGKEINEQRVKTLYEAGYTPAQIAKVVCYRENTVNRILGI